MKTIYSAQDPLAVGHLRNLLVSEGIECEVRTPFLAAASGDLPITECWSELRITNDEDYARALALIDTALERGAEPAVSWKCSVCGEDVEKQFGLCWKCGAASPDSER